MTLQLHWKRVRYKGKIIRDLWLYHYFHMGKAMTKAQKIRASARVLRTKKIKKN